MQRIQYDLKRFEKKEEKVDKEICATKWQTYALKVINDFKIKKVEVEVFNKKKGILEKKTLDFPGMIFQKCKKNMGFVESKVALVYEKCGMDNGKIENYGNYLISLFRKTPPWEKK